MAGLKAKVVKGSMWISASRAITNIIAFISTLVLARLLAPEDFGLVALATTMLAIISSLTELSMTSALIHHRNVTDDHLHTAFTLNMLRGAFIGALFCVFAPFAGALYGEPHLPPVMYALGVNSFIFGLGNPRRVMLSKELIFWQDFLLNVSQKLATLIVSIAIAYVYRSYWALVLGLLVGQVIGSIVSYMAVPFRPRVRFRHARELWSFSIWLTFSQMINTLNWRFDQLLVGTLLGRTALGFYSMGDNLAVMPTREATVPLTQTLFPGCSKHANDLAWLRNAYQQAQGVVTAIALPVGVGVALIADPIVRLAMGEKWLPVTMIVQVLASVFAIQTLGTLVQPLAMARGMTKMLFKRDAQLFAIRIPIIAAGAYFGGLPGIVFARAIAGFIGIAINMNLVREITSLPIMEQLRANLRAIASVALMAAVVVGVQTLVGNRLDSTGLLITLLASVAAGGVTYLASNACLWMAMGRPAGPETELARMAQLVLGVLRPRRASEA